MIILRDFMRKFLSLVIVLFAVIFSNTSFAGFDEGMVAYKVDKFDIALKEWRLVADQGHVLAQHILGFMYDNGQGVAKDAAQAAQWYRKAAEQGHRKSQYT
jgi:hypothetical protein